MLDIDDQDMEEVVLHVPSCGDICVDYLKHYGIFSTPFTCYRREGFDWRERMVEKKRLGRVTLRCTNWRCATYRSLPSANEFFACDGWRQLPLKTIVKLVWIWPYSCMNAQQAVRASGLSKDTAVRWFAKFRSVYIFVEIRILLMTETDE